MSDEIHEHCGIALIRLLKPLSYYKEKYGTDYYGIHKLYLLMEKQHNRGQDGAGVAAVKFDMPPGMPVIHRLRSPSQNALEEIFGKINRRLANVQENKPHKLEDAEWMKKKRSICGRITIRACALWHVWKKCAGKLSSLDVGE